MTAPDDFIELKRRLSEIHDLGKAGALLSWDQVVMMPPGGAAARAEQMATLDTIAHERFISPEIGRLLDRLHTYEQDLPYESDDASLIRVTRVDYEKARKVPTALSAEMTRVATETFSRPSARETISSSPSQPRPTTLNRIPVSFFRSSFSRTAAITSFRA